MKQIRSIHPFPARMAPELALGSLEKLKKGSVVLDPMAGSGTVLRQALSLGHDAIGFDMDPLAVLMSRVWTTPVDEEAVQSELEGVLFDAKAIDLRSAILPWFTREGDTQDFVLYWFGDTQRRELKRIAYVLYCRTQARLGPRRSAAVDVLRLALSRIIVTKEQGASLARDTSHSRPHKVCDSTNYDVPAGFERSAKQLLSRLLQNAPLSAARVELGDARELSLESESVDAVVTSPPYLNAIDYLRGHRMSLVWLGYSIEELRGIRSSSIGAERSRDGNEERDAVAKVARAMIGDDSLPAQLIPMVQRYAYDLVRMTSQVGRVLKKHGRATFVVGNSCLRGCFVKNSDGLAKAATLSGLVRIDATERELPIASRYLPVTGNSLSKRMRTETVLTFGK